MSNAPRPATGDELLEHGDGLIELDRNWVIVRVNASQERTTGKQRSETLGRVFWDVWPEIASPDGAQWRAYHRCMEERVPAELQDYYAPFDIWLHITAYPTSTGGIAVFFRDVTNQKRAELSVRAERDFSTAILDTLASLVVVLDTDGRIVRFNAACERATGFAVSEVLGRSVFEILIPEADLPGTRETFRQLRMGDFPNQHRNRWRMKDGPERLFDWSNTAIPDEQGAVQFIIATGVDITERERSLEVLRDSEERYRSVFDSAAVGIGRVALDGRFLEVNDAYVRLVGYGREELLRLDFQTITHPDDLSSDVRLLEDLLSGRTKSYAIDKRYIRKNGSTVWVSLSVGLARDAAGRPAYCSVVAQDISARKDAEEALQQNGQRLRATFDDAVIGIVEVDEEDRFVAVNHAFCRMLGYACDELIGRTLHDVTAPEDREVTRELNAKGHAGELNDFEYEKRYVRRDGSKLWVQVNVRVVRSVDGRFVRAVGAAQDITERKRAEMALRDTNAMLDAALASATDAVYIADPAGGLIRFNEAFARFHRFPSVEACARTFADFPELFEAFTLDGKPAPADTWATPRALRGETAEKVEWIVQRKDSGERWVGSYSFAPIRRDGSILGAVVVIRDVTEQHRLRSELQAANERLREADRRKNEFLGMLSHELRNPLAPIRNALYILDRSRPEGQQARRAKDIVGRQVSHLTRLVDDLLDVTRIARGKVELRHEDLDLGGLVRRVAEDYRPIMQDRGLDLAVAVPDQPVLVNGDPARLTQVFGNLLNNAAKFTPAGGRVSISLRPEGPRAVVHVVDTGPGIAPELVPSLFEPFTQGKQTLARSEGGLGLGLSLVKGLVALHGGEVTVTGQEGAGADFTVVLSLSRPAAPSRDTSAPAAVPRTPRYRVLVVDDNRDAAESLRDLMQMLGHDVEVAYDGPSAIAKAGTTHPDVVLCDIGLPGMDGYQVARGLRAQHDGDLRIVALSGYAQPDDVERAFEAGFDAHVAKPPDPEQLAHILECRGCRRATDSPHPGVVHAP